MRGCGVDTLKIELQLHRLAIGRAIQQQRLRPFRLRFLGYEELSLAKRVQILTLLCEATQCAQSSGSVGCSINTVDKLLRDAGEASLAYHDEHVRGVKAQRIQCDEIWSFVNAEAKNAPKSKRAGDPTIGDCRTWTAIDADSKLLLSYLVGGRDAEFALMLIDDLRQRLANRVQLTTDGHRAYLQAVEDAFGADVDYATLIKSDGEPPSSPEAARGYSPSECVGTRPENIAGNPDPKHVNTSYAERANLTVRMAVRRFTRLTNAFSKKVENHCHMVALYALWYNFVHIHKSLRITPAMAAGIGTRLWTMDDMVRLIEAARIFDRERCWSVRVRLSPEILPR
jgi:IS1 family transposase